MPAKKHPAAVSAADRHSYADSTRKIGVQADNNDGDKIISKQTLDLNQEATNSSTTSKETTTSSEMTNSVPDSATQFLNVIGSKPSKDARAKMLLLKNKNDAIQHTSSVESMQNHSVAGSRQKSIRSEKSTRGSKRRIVENNESISCVKDDTLFSENLSTVRRYRVVSGVDCANRSFNVATTALDDTNVASGDANKAINSESSPLEMSITDDSKNLYYFKNNSEASKAFSRQTIDDLDANLYYSVDMRKNCEKNAVSGNSSNVLNSDPVYEDFCILKNGGIDSMNYKNLTHEPSSSSSSATTNIDDETNCVVTNRKLYDISIENMKPNDKCDENLSPMSYCPSNSSLSTLVKLQNFETIENLCNQMGYRIYQENGQRKFCSPEYDNIKLDKGCEVFIGKIPRDCFEDELVPVLSKIGRIYELRLMMDFSGTTRGFGFVSYFSPEDAQKAVSKLNNFEIRPGIIIGVCLSIDNCRLFIGGIPKFKTKKEIFEEMSKITDDVVDVIVYPSVNDKMKNRGFAFVEYQTHRAAAMARRRLIPGKISLWGSTVAVDWAEPELDVPKGIMNTVKILYVRNLMLYTSEELLCEIFARAANCEISEIERVRKLRDFCFIHFSSREYALRAMEVMNGEQIDGSTIEVTLAKPVDKNSRYYNRLHRLNNQYNSTHNFHNYYNMNKNPFINRYYNNVPPSQMTNANIPSSQLVNNNQISRHNQISHRPVQFANLNHNINSNANSYNNLNHHSHLNSYIPQPIGNTFFSCVKLLDDICYANNWGTPKYELSIYSTENGVFYSFHVNIPNLNQFFAKELLETVDCNEFGTFAAKEFIPGLEEAKEMCAGRIISCLDILSQRSIMNNNISESDTNVRSASPTINQDPKDPNDSTTPDDSKQMNQISTTNLLNSLYETKQGEKNNDVQNHEHLQNGLLNTTKVNIFLNNPNNESQNYTPQNEVNN